jgi:predicted nucleotide-binding protein
MAAINPALLERIARKLDISVKAVYPRITKVQREHHGLLRPEAALLLASQLGININIRKLATDEQRRAIAPARISSVNVVPSEPANAPTKYSPKSSKRKLTAKFPKSSKHVWVVVGRNLRVNKAMMQFLRALGLSPLEWSKAVKLTGKPNPYIGEILDAAFKKAQRVVVLMTPDDEARLRAEFITDDDEEFEKKLTGQARPNVLFEAGFAMGMYPNATVLVRVGKLRVFSDIGGRHVSHLGNSTQSRQDFAARLKAIGLDVDMDGTDWHTEGDFAIASKGAVRR